MSDLISKRFIQDALIERISNLNAEGEKSIQTARELIRFKKFVDGITPIRAEIVHGWIPVSERLPDLRTEVIYSFDGIVSTGYMTDRDYEGEKTESHWEDLESGVTIEPIAWMPLPEPYREDGEA